MSVLLVAEKPSAARNMAKALGGMRGSYAGTPYEIVALRGHLYQFKEPHEQVEASLADKYKSWSLNNLPWKPEEVAWKRKPSVQGGVSEILRELAVKAKTANEVVCATDVDPTGEGGLLFAEPFVELKIVPKKLTRMYFTDESEKSIQKAFVSRKEIVGGLGGFDEYRKALTRTKFDWLTQQFTRVATRVSGQRGVLLRQGRLKSAMILLVGEQLKAYNEYVKKPFFQNRFVDENGVIYSNPEEPVFDNPGQVPGGYSVSGVVVDSKTLKTTPPPRLLDLAGLSARLSKKGIKAETVLKTYQRMYEDQVVSYPRTEDKHITVEQFQELLPLVDSIAGVVGVDVGVLTRRVARKTHVKDSGAHGANRPGVKVPAGLGEVDTKYGDVGVAIYTELARSFLAMFAEDYRYEAVVGHVVDYPGFVGRVAVPQSLGWRFVFETSETVDEETGKGLGERAEPFVFEGANKRPEHPSMAWLMKRLEKHDVGTGATRTSTYAEVTRAKSPTNKFPLMVEKKGKLTLSEFGDMGFRLLPGTRIGDIRLTEYVYQEMREVAAGNKTPEEVISVVGAWVCEDIETMKNNSVTMRKDLGLVENSVDKETYRGVWVAGGNRPVVFNRVWSGYRFTDEECETLLSGGELTVTAVSAKKQAAGQADPTFVCRGVLAEQTFNGNNFVGFKMVGFGALGDDGAELPPKSWCGHVFTEDELVSLKAGRKIYADDFVSKKSGRKFAATVSFAVKDGAAKRIVAEFG